MKVPRSYPPYAGVVTRTRLAPFTPLYFISFNRFPEYYLLSYVEISFIKWSITYIS